MAPLVPAAFARACGRFLRCRAGAGVVEFAIVVPVFLAMALAVMEYGRLFWIRSTVEHAADEAGRLAIANPTATAETLVARAKTAAGSLDPDKVNATATSETIAGIDYVTIQTSYQFEFISGLFGSDPLLLEGRSRVPLIEP